MQHDQLSLPLHFSISLSLSLPSFSTGLHLFSQLERGDEAYDAGAQSTPASATPLAKHVSKNTCTQKSRWHAMAKNAAYKA